jgi:predicted small metal-binding protein
MEKIMLVLKCRDVGFDCEGVVRAETKEQILKQAAEHAATVHGVKITPDIAAKVEQLIKVEGSI